MHSPSQRYLHIPSPLEAFTNTESELRSSQSGREVVLLKGELDLLPTDRTCPKCEGKLHINDGGWQVLRHLPIGASLTNVSFIRRQMFCPQCGHTHMQEVPFKSEHHRITKPLETYVCDLLATGNYTNKEVSELTGLGPNTVKEIDKRRLTELYTEDGKLKKPEARAVFLGIDEFKLHNGHKYATHIIDLVTGKILWIAEGKGKKVVLDFIDHVGMDWMQTVKAVAMDMNSDFQEAFQARCPHVAIVFDHFHIIKNFNEMVVAEARKDEQQRLIKEGRPEDARALKKCGRILCMSRKTMEEIEEKVAAGKAIHKGSGLFGIPEYRYKGGWKELYEALLRDNDLLTLVDIVKCKLAEAYEIGSDDERLDYALRIYAGKAAPMTAEERMKKCLDEIIDICKSTGKWYFHKFQRLLENHMAGLVSHTTYRLSSGKIEGINNKIKTLRRQAYGYPDDEYFFLKLLDMSRYDKRRKLVSHRICD